VVLLQDLSVLSKQALFLLLHDSRLSALILLLLTHLLEFELPLGPVDGQLLLPESLDLALVLLLPHASLLGVHLLQTLVVSKLLHQLLFEFVLHSAFFCLAFDLQTLLVSLGCKEVLLDLLSLLKLLLLSLAGLFFKLLEVKFVAEVFDVLVFSSPLLLLLLELLEDLLSSGLSFSLLSLDLSLTSLLLLSITPKHLVLILLELFLLSEELSLLGN